jgi:hypothetical protein
MLVLFEIGILLALEDQTDDALRTATKFGVKGHLEQVQVIDPFLH